MSKIDPNANLYDIDGNIISKAPLKNKSIDEVEQLIDELTKKVQDNPDNEVYKVYLNNAQSFLFGMYNNMNREDLMKRLSVLQNSIQTAKDKANDTEKEQLDSVNKALDELKESVSNETESIEEPQERPETKMDEYVEFEEVKE